MKVGLCWNLNDITLEIPSNDTHQQEFRIVFEDKSFSLKAKSEEDRNDWIEAIEGAIAGLEDVITRSITNVTNFISDCSSGDVEPVFFPDSMAQFCQVKFTNNSSCLYQMESCENQFTWTLRRHHCRCCGAVVCGSCSAHKLPLKYNNDKKERVCLSCYNTGGLMSLHGYTNFDRTSFRAS